MDHQGNSKGFNWGKAWGNRGNFNDLLAGMQSGFDLSAEDRRNILNELRERENKSEAPRLDYIQAQHPVIDALRQAKTFENPAIAQFIPVAPLSDEAVAFRANNQLNIPVGSKQELTHDPKQQRGESKIEWEARRRKAREQLHC